MKEFTTTAKVEHAVALQPLSVSELISQTLYVLS